MFHALVFQKNLKNLTLGPFWPLLAQKPLNKIVLKKIIKSIFKTLGWCNSIQKIKETPHIYLDIYLF